MDAEIELVTLFDLASTDAPIDHFDATQRDLVVIDLETTGKDAHAHEICEIAMVRVRNGRIIDEWTTLVNPRTDNLGPWHIHNLWKHQVRTAPSFAEIAGAVVHRLQGATIVAHNAAFEGQFLWHELRRVGIELPTLPAICTVTVDEAVHPDAPSHALPDVCARYGIPLIDAHAALIDARATAWMAPVLFKEARAAHKVPRGTTLPQKLPVPDLPEPRLLIRPTYGDLGPGAGVARGASAPGWYPDRSQEHEYRWWDGERWTPLAASNGTQLEVEGQHLVKRFAAAPRPYQPNVLG